MKKVNNVLWGLVIIAVGVCLLLREFNILTCDIFFPGWWSLFIIVPCTISLVTRDHKVWSLLGIVIGVLLLLGEQEVLDRYVAHRLILPAVLICVGLNCLVNAMCKKDKPFYNVDFDIKSEGFTQEHCEGQKVYNILLTGQNISYDDQVFSGASIKAMLGGGKLDLRRAIFESDVQIYVQCLLGGVEIYVPSDVNVVVSCNNVLGGVDTDKVHNPGAGHKTIYLTANCVLGGLDIKN